MNKRKQNSARPCIDPVIDPRTDINVIPPGTLVNLRGLDRDETHYKLGTLWVWTRGETTHYLMQASHRKHCHRVQAVFWTSVIANAVRNLIDAGMHSDDMAVYTMLREAGVIPIDWHKPTRKKRK